MYWLMTIFASENAMKAEARKTISQYPLLKNAPIVEALLDIQVQLPESKTLDDLHFIFDKIKEQFPLEKKRYRFSSSVEFKAEEKEAKPSVTNTLVDGFLFYSQTKKKVFQSRLDGFTFNQHKPYDKWSTFLKEAQELWELYKTVAEPIAIKRIALRFINKIPLKMPFDPSNYFTTLPKLAPELDYDVQNLFSQISIANNKIFALANITEGVEIDGTENAQFLFDIDVFKIGDFKEQDIWGHFQDLRNFKNEIFFKSLTETTLKLLA